MKHKNKKQTKTNYKGNKITTNNNSNTKKPSKAHVKTKATWNDNKKHK